MLKSFLAASCLVSLVACVKQDDAPAGIAGALPTTEQMSIKLPEQRTRSIGQLATWYVATRDITRTLNGGTAGVLLLLHRIVALPVTSVDGDTFTWGPGSEPLDPADYKLDVRVVGDGTYEYQLSGRSKTEAGAPFVVIVDGTADPRRGEREASGQLVVDFDAGRRANPLDSDDARGTLDVRYDLAARHLDLTLMSTDVFGQPALAEYAYNESDTGGDMTFALRGNAGGGEALESATLRSRWLDSGAGRADGVVGGGDLGTVQATASECWDAGFRRVFYTDSVAFSGTEGVATSCAFPTADVPAPR